MRCYKYSLMNSCSSFKISRRRASKIWKGPDHAFTFPFMTSPPDSFRFCCHKQDNLELMIIYFLSQIEASHLEDTASNHDKFSQESSEIFSLEYENPVTYRKSISRQFLGMIDCPSACCYLPCLVPENCPPLFWLVAFLGFSLLFLSL